MSENNVVSTPKAVGVAVSEDLTQEQGIAELQSFPVKSERELELEEKRKFFHGEPLMNVVSKEEFQKRVEKVFNMISETLACSFGAYGSPVIISNYPYSHVTKDGYTIYKNISFDVECGSLIDCTIANMIGDICGRLNYKVGDGTTTAIVATNAIYQSYYQNKAFFDNAFILPRDIIAKFGEIKDEIVKRLREKSFIFTKDKETMIDSIRKIVHISSNGDEKVTNMITEIYEKIGYPSITVELSKDGVTRYNIIDGYRGDIFLTDKLYINSDDGFSDNKNVDVIMFDHKIETECYERIIRPLYQYSRGMGRKLLVVAPVYSDNTMQNVIRKEMIEEYKRERKLSLILTTCKATTASAKRNLSDVAMLFNTTVIDRQLERTILEEISKTPEDEYKLLEFFDYNRGIEDSFYLVTEEEDGVKKLSITKDLTLRSSAFETDEKSVIVGYTGECRIGVEYSIFSKFAYNEDLYERYLDDAKKTMEDMIEKYARLGTFSYEVTEAIKRYNALQLQTAIIEAGGDSELSKAMLKDSIEDAIRAADSAYNNGYILGCNLTTIQTINEMLRETSEEFEKLDENDESRLLVKTKGVLLDILYNGFISVYRVILGNAYPNLNIEIHEDVVKTEDLNEILNDILKRSFNIDTVFVGDFLKNYLGDILKMTRYEKENQDLEKTDKEKEENNEGEDKINIHIDLFSVIINYSINSGLVFDLETKKFSNEIINSAATDIEVLTAIVDLISILITGSQLVMKATR